MRNGAGCSVYLPSHSRFAKMAHAEKSVSIDLLVRANLSLGATPQELKHVL